MAGSFKHAMSQNRGKLPMNCSKYLQIIGKLHIPAGLSPSWRRYHDIGWLDGWVESSVVIYDTL